MHPLLSERRYGFLQGVAKAWDIRTGTWTEPELDLIPLAIRSGETALDIGANYGLYAYHLSRAVGAHGKVYAFEPVPFTVSTLKVVRRLLRLGNVEIVAKGCGDRAGRIVFTVPTQKSGAISASMAYGRSGAEHLGPEAPSRYDTTISVTCEMERIDELIPDRMDVSFIKCDIEGTELLALRGGTRTIERTHPTVVCEIYPGFLEDLGIALSDLLRFFTDRDYVMYRYDVSAGRSPRLKPIAASQITGENYVFVHPSRADRLHSVMEAS